MIARSSRSRVRVTHRLGPNAPALIVAVSAPQRTARSASAAIPPHIREDIKSHLAQHVPSNPDALLFVPVRGGCHVNDRVFNKDVFQTGVRKTLGEKILSAHDLRRFAGSKNAQVATLTENMARLGHKTVGAALRYQHSESGRDAIIANALSAKAIEELESSADG